MRLLAITFIVLSFLAVPCFADESATVIAAKIKSIRAQNKISTLRIEETTRRVEAGEISVEDAKAILDEEGKNLARYDAQLKQYGDLIEQRIQEIDRLLERAKKTDTM